MVEHWCKEHKMAWFKKGKMSRFAHPILDDEGNQLKSEEGKVVWCNEPKEEPAISQQQPEKSSESPARQSSIEAQNAYTGIVSLMVAGIVKKEESLGQTAINYATSKLSWWSSLGEEGEPKPSPDEVESIRKAVKEKTSSPVPSEVKQGAKPKRDPKAIKTIEQLARALKEDFGLSFKQQLDELSISSWNDLIIAPSEAYLMVASTR